MALIVENSPAGKCGFFSLLSTVSFWPTVSWVSISSRVKCEVWISSVTVLSLVAFKGV